jgi:hypothetical protein
LPVGVRINALKKEEKKVVQIFSFVTNEAEIKRRED